jgi:hypothetical protein
MKSTRAPHDAIHATIPLDPIDQPPTTAQATSDMLHVVRRLSEKCGVKEAILTIDVRYCI